MGHVDTFTLIGKVIFISFLWEGASSHFQTIWFYVHEEEKHEHLLSF